MKIEIREISEDGFFNTEVKSLVGKLFLDGKSAGSIQVTKGNDFNENVEARITDRKIIKMPKPIIPNEAEKGIMEYFMFSNDNNSLEKKQRYFFSSLQKRMADQFLIAKEDNTIISLKLNLQLSWVMLQPDGKKHLVKLIRKHVQEELKNGGRLLNTNIPHSLLLHAGIKNGVLIAKSSIAKKRKLSL